MNKITLGIWYSRKENNAVGLGSVKKTVYEWKWKDLELEEAMAFVYMKYFNEDV